MREMILLIGLLGEIGFGYALMKKLDVFLGKLRENARKEEE